LQSLWSGRGLESYAGSVGLPRLPLSDLGYYLDEFTFRFNRRKSRSRGKLFYRLVQQAVQVEPVPYRGLVGGKDAKAVNHNG
jgi:hypothetical protein